MSTPNWVIRGPGLVGAQAIDTTSTAQNHPLGTVVPAIHATYGEGVFVYLKGVASTAVGDAVIYDNNAKSTTRLVDGGRGPVAVAMSANVASQYGWYQVEGLAVVNALTVAAQKPCFITATAGSIDDAADGGDTTGRIAGMVTKTSDGTPSAGKALCQLTFPSTIGTA